MVNFVNRLNQYPGRPVQVTNAVYLLLAFLAINFLVYVVQMIVLLLDLPEQYTYGTYFFELFLFFIGYVLDLYIAFKIASGKNWARWLFLFAFVFILIGSACTMAELISGEPTVGILSLGRLLVSAVVVALLFQRPSSLWFTSGESQEEIRAEDEVIEGYPDTQPAATEEIDKAPPPKSIKYWLILSQVIYVLLLVPWFLVLLAGQAAETGWQVALVFVTFAHPITAIVCGIVSWFLYANHRFKWASIVTSLPLLPFIIFFFLMISYEVQNLI